MERKFFAHKIVELIEIYDESRDNLAVLRELEDELKCRKTDKAKKLLIEVQERIIGLSGDNVTAKSSIKQLDLVDSFDSSDIDINVKSENEKERSFDFKNFRDVGDWEDLPKKLEFALSDELKLDINEADSIITKYRIALEALIHEIRNQSSGAQRFQVQDGKAISLPEVTHGYSFHFDGEADVFEGLKITAFIASEHFEGKVHGVNGKELILSFSKPLPPSALKVCTLIMDKAAFLEILKERYKDLEEGKLKAPFNVSLANDMLNNESKPIPLDETHAQYLPKENFNEYQKKAVLTGLSNKVTYMWGPPGTGKTATITALIERYYNLGKRVLLISNTNQAVDQVFLKVCEKIKKLSDGDKVLDSGKIIRMGKIKKEDLADQYGKYLNLDEIVEKKSRELLEEKQTLTKRMELILNEISSDLDFLKKYKDIKILQEEKISLDTSLFKTNRDIDTLSKTIDKCANSLLALGEELAKSEKAGAIRKLFLRDEVTIKAGVVSEQEKIGAAKKEISALREEINEIKKKSITIMNRLTLLLTEVAGNSQDEVKQRLAQSEGQKILIQNEISIIEKKLKEIKEQILQEALLVGATVTKVFTSANMFANFDCIIADEASMIMLPGLYFVAGLAKESVFISGDSRQLSPIVQTNQKAIVDLIGSDILTRIIEEKGMMDRVVKLEEQYRMCKDICDLVSDNYTTLKVGRKEPVLSCENELLNHSLIIVDTSELYPYVQNDVFKSRYNIMNIIVGKTIAKALESYDEKSKEKKSIGICTPYAAQAKILDRTLDQKEFVSGTIHKYQGDDKDTMIIDIPDSLGAYRVGMFLGGAIFDPTISGSLDSGTKLFNVAISRAKERLVIIGNLKYLDGKLPQNAYLRKVIYHMINQGIVIDARRMFNVKDYDEQLDLTVNSISFGKLSYGNALYNEKSFPEGVILDIKNAEKSILIYSGFITPERVSFYEPVFRKKLSDGVKIKCVTRPSKSNGSMNFDATRVALESLENMGCIVETRAAIHEKLVAIDDKTAWIGSLNPLSYNGKTNELMIRIEDPSLVRQFELFLSIGKQKNENFDPITRENPRCPECDGRTTYAVSKYGSFWSCEDCTWKKSLK